MSVIRPFSELNEDIKAVCRTTRRMVLMSFNAMFTARHVGEQAAAYAHVTTELRRFSRELENNMQALQHRVDEAVVRASEYQHQLRFTQLAEAACRLSKKRWERTHRTLWQAGSVRLSERRQNLGAAERELSRQIAAAQRVSMKGENLAVLAKVEAGHVGGANSRRLAQVSEDVAGIMADLASRLQASRARIEAAAKEDIR